MGHMLKNILLYLRTSCSIDISRKYVTYLSIPHWPTKVGTWQPCCARQSMQDFLQRQSDHFQRLYTIDDDIKHNYTKEVYQNDVCFVTHSPRTTKFCSDRLSLWVLDMLRHFGVNNAGYERTIIRYECSSNMPTKYQSLTAIMSLWHRGAFCYHCLTSSPLWVSNYMHHKVWEMKLLIHSQTSMVRPLKFENGYII